MKKIVLMAMMIATGMSATAQDEIETTVAADFVSSYIWRGQDLGSAAVQPTLGVGYKGLSLTAWGSYGLVNTADTKEFDLTLAYTTGGFNIGITDYWFNAGLDSEGRYFKYDAHGTNHVFEANIGYDFGPAAIQWFSCPIPPCYSRLDCYSWCRPLGHNVIRHKRLCGYQPGTESHEGNQSDGHILYTRLRTGGRQSVLTECIPGLWLYAAAMILPDTYPPLVAMAGRGFFNSVPDNRL